MQVLNIGKTTMKIILSGKELARAGLTGRDMTGDSPQSAALITKIVEAVYTQRGLSVPQCRLFAEVFPTGGKGCVLYISSINGNLFPETGNAVIITDSIPALINAARLIKPHLSEKGKSRLYADSRSFKLTAEITESEEPVTAESEKYVNIIPATESVLAHISEHCRTIIGENAVETLSSLET